MSDDGYEELSGGHEPARQRRPRRTSQLRAPGWWRRLRRLASGWSPSAWGPQLRRAVTVTAVIALALAGAGRWAWDRTHPPSDASALRVQVDSSEYLLAGPFDGQGQAEVLLLVRVDVAAGLAGPVRLLRLHGGGITADVEQEVGGSPWRHAVRARVSCDQWADGKAVRASFRLGPGDGHTVDVDLDAGRNSPVHAQITAPCQQFAKNHPLRLTVFSVALAATEPAALTTWTLVNRSGAPITLSPGYGDVQLSGTADPPLTPRFTDDAVVVGPHATVSVLRTLDVTDCRTPNDLDPTGMSVRMIGWEGDPQAPSSFRAVVDLPDTFVRQVFAVARDTCVGGPDMASAQAVLTLVPGGAGKGQARLDVGGFVDRDGPWSVRLVSTAGLHADSDAPTGRTRQELQGPDLFSLSVSWTVRGCVDSLIGLHHGDFLGDRAVVELHSIRTYPYAIPVTITGHTRCTPADLSG